MKIEFRKGDEQQEAVTPAQDEMREARSHKWPVFKTLVLMAILSGLGYGYWFWSRMETVYTYGIVSAENETFRAPLQGMLESMELKRGFHVNKDDLLFTITPVLSEKEQQAEQGVRDEFTETQEDAASVEINNLDRARSEAARFKAIYDDDVGRKEHAIWAAVIEVEKLEKFYDAKKERYEKLAKLRDMDAALDSDVRASEHEMQMALHNVEKARLDLEHTMSRTLPSRAAYEKAQLEVKIAKEAQGSGKPEMELDQARFELTVAMKKRDPIEFHAPSDGVVLEVSSVNGSLVSAGDMIASIAASKPIWVDTFIPVRKSVWCARAIRLWFIWQVTGIRFPVLSRLKRVPL